MSNYKEILNALYKIETICKKCKLNFIIVVLIMNSIILKRYFKFSNNFSISIAIILGILVTFILYRKNLNIKDIINNGIINGSNALFITASQL